ncbi:uncharacterized protein [Rutidosis leptorrhynchoides]|uniref:uncharacterized protein n=1 Tax=Rutidosis leptorrhynchoides TaxID=125765 RepID=UPI003A9928EB
MFEGVMRMQHWQDETACHMFPMVLQKMAREWFVSLSPQSITSFLDLMAEFVMQYQSLRSCTLSHLDVHEINMHQNESLSNFMKRYTIECQKILDIPESQLVSGFIFCLDQRRFASLIDALWYDVPKTLHQALVVEKKHLRAGKMGIQELIITRGIIGSRMGGRTGMKTIRGNVGMIMVINDNNMEILFTEPIKETFNPPPQGLQSDRWCDYHEEYGHDTDSCKSLMREIIANIKAGELNHLLPGIHYRRNDPSKCFAWQGKVHHGGQHDWNRREERKDERDPTPERYIKVIWNEEEEHESGM